MCDPSKPVKFIQFFILRMSFPPVVAIKMVSLLSSILIIVEPVVRETLLKLVRQIVQMISSLHVYPSYPHKMMFRSFSFVESLTLYRPYESAMRSASSFNKSLLFEARCCLKPMWLVCVISDDKSDSDDFPLIITGFRYEAGKIFSVFPTAFSICRSAWVLPLPRRKRTKLFNKSAAKFFHRCLVANHFASEYSLVTTDFYRAKLN